MAQGESAMKKPLMKLKIYEAVDGPPEFCIRMGFEWRLESAKSHVIAQCNNGFKTRAACRTAALALPLAWRNIEVIEIDKFNPFDPEEYKDGRFSP